MTNQGPGISLCSLFILSLPDRGHFLVKWNYANTWLLSLILVLKIQNILLKLHGPLCPRCQSPDQSSPYWRWGKALKQPPPDGALNCNLIHFKISTQPYTLLLQSSTIDFYTVLKEQSECPLDQTGGNLYSLPTSIGNSVRFKWPHVTGESRQFIQTVGFHTAFTLPLVLATELFPILTSPLCPPTVLHCSNF